MNPRFLSALKLYFFPILIVVCGMFFYTITYQELILSKTQTTPQQISLTAQTQEVQNDMPKGQGENLSPSVLINEEQEAKKIMLNQDSEKSKDDVEYNTYYVDTTVLNIRQKPSQSARIVGKLHQKEEVEVIEIVGEWAKISNGWVKFNYLTKG